MLKLISKTRAIGNFLVLIKHRAKFCVLLIDASKEHMASREETGLVDGKDMMSSGRVVLYGNRQVGHILSSSSSLALLLVLIIVLTVGVALIAFVALSSPLLAAVLAMALTGGLVFFCRPYLALLFLLFVIPFQFMTNISGDGAITLPKLMLPVVVAVWGLNHLINRNARLVRAFFAHPFFIGVLLFLLSLIPSYLNVRSPGLFFGFILTKMLPYFILSVILADLINTRERLRRFFSVMFLSAFIVTGFGIVEVITDRSILNIVGMEYHLVGGADGELVSTKRAATDDWASAEWVRVASTFLDSNYFAGFMLLSLVSVFGYWIVFRQKWHCFVVPVYCVMVLVCLLSTGSRGGLIGFVVLVCLSLVFFNYPLKKFIVVGAAVIAMLSLPFMNKFLTESFRQGISFEAFYKDTRYGMWMTAKEMVEANPVVGVGFGNFTHRWHNYRDARARTQPYLPHNTTLGVLAETGIIGLFFFLLALFLLASSMLHQWRTSQNSRKKTMIKLSAVGLIAFYAYSFTTNTIDSEILWTTLGLVVACLMMPDREFLPEPKPQSCHGR